MFGSPGGTPPTARSSRSGARRGALTPAQERCAAYVAARVARGLSSQASSCGEGALAAAAAAAQRPASTSSKPRRRRAPRVEDFLCLSATEQRARVPSGCAARAVSVAASAVLPPRRLAFDAGECSDGEKAHGGAERSAAWCRDAHGGTADSASAPEPRLAVSLRVDDTDSGVLCELRLEAPPAGDVADALARMSVADRTQSPGAAPVFLRCSSTSARLARLGMPPLSRAAQRMSYLGFCAPLLAHMAARGLRTITTAAVRRWLVCAPEAGDLAARLCAAHGVESFAELQVDHVVARKWGGTDHPFNFFIMRRALNASFNSDVTQEKVERYMGRAVASVVAAFCAFCKAAADRAVDYGAFERELVMHM